jgi:putative ABC transport system permease protein
MSTMAQDSLRASYEQMSGRAATLTLETDDPRLSADPTALRQAADPVLEEFSITRTTVLSQTQVLVTGEYGDEWADTLLIEPDHGTIFSTELVAGRWFAPGDEQNLAPAAVVNENVLEDQGLTASDLPASIELAATEGAAPLTATVIGVTPGNQWEMREVRLLAGAPAATALAQEPQQFSLQAWVPEEIADDLAQQVSSRLSTTTGGTWSGYRSDAFAFGDDPLGVLRTILLAIAGLILFLGVMGLLNIALVTVQQRVREIGIRRSFGATGARVFFSVMMESVVATSLAGVVGIAVSVLILRTPAVMAILTDGMAATPAFPVSAALVGFAVSVGAGALAGLLPAIVATRARIVDAIRA